MTTSHSTADRARETAGTAQDEGRHVAGVAKEEARTVASEAVRQTKGVVDDALSQVGEQVSEQSRAQRDRLVGLLQTFGQDLGRMAADGDSSSLATQAAREAADRVQALGRRLDGREPAELLQEVRGFARRRPGTFLLGALAAGMLTGRLLRSAREGTPETPTTTTTTGSAAVTPPGESGLPTTNPPRPVSTPGQPTVEETSVADAPMGTPAAGYAQRGTTGVEQP